MINILIKSGLLVILSIISGCMNDQRFIKHDLIGTWKSKDGAQLILNHDFTFEAKKIKLSKIISNFNEQNYKNNTICYIINSYYNFNKLFMG